MASFVKLSFMHCMPSMASSLQDAATVDVASHPCNKLLTEFYLEYKAIYSLAGKHTVKEDALLIPRREISLCCKWGWNILFSAQRFHNQATSNPGSSLYYTA